MRCPEAAPLSVVAERSHEFPHIEGCMVPLGTSESLWSPHFPGQRRGGHRPVTECDENKRRPGENDHATIHPGKSADGREHSPGNRRAALAAGFRHRSGFPPVSLPARVPRRIEHRHCLRPDPRPERHRHAPDARWFVSLHQRYRQQVQPGPTDSFAQGERVLHPLPGGDRPSALAADPQGPEPDLPAESPCPTSSSRSSPV